MKLLTHLHPLGWLMTRNPEVQPVPIDIASWNGDDLTIIESYPIVTPALAEALLNLEPDAKIFDTEITLSDDYLEAFGQRPVPDFKIVLHSKHLHRADNAYGVEVSPKGEALLRNYRVTGDPVSQEWFLPAETPETTESDYISLNLVSLDGTLEEDPAEKRKGDRINADLALSPDFEIGLLERYLCINNALFIRMIEHDPQIDYLEIRYQGQPKGPNGRLYLIRRSWLIEVPTSDEGVKVSFQFRSLL